MKEIFYTEDTPENKISYYLLLVFLVTLPFDRVYSELSLIGLLLHTLLHPATGRKFSFRWAGWLVTGLFFLMLISSLYTPHFSDAGRQLEKQLALLLFPLIAWYSRLDWNKVRAPLLKAFAFSCTFTVIYLYGCAFTAIHQQGLGWAALFTPDFLNHSFTAPIDLHATYFSMDVGISVIVAVGLGLKSDKILVKWGYGLMSLLLLAAILQLASRAVCLAMLVVINVLVPWLLLSGRSRRIALLVFVSMSLLSVVLVTTNKDLYTRYLVSLKQDMQDVRGNAEDPEPRMVRWGCAWELIRESPWIGYGAGAEVGRLKEKYYTRHLVLSYTHELNAHNQYLSYWLNTGIGGVLLYLCVLIAGGMVAVRRRDILLSTFIVMIVFVSFSENILDTNKGIFFFSFFFILFLYDRVELPVAPVGSVEPVSSVEPVGSVALAQVV
ncbi:MAG TPA: O-antigen ligase family protein [Puia sp.]|jgi:O-antigen ligase